MLVISDCEINKYVRVYVFAGGDFAGQLDRIVNSVLTTRTFGERSSGMRTQFVIFYLIMRIGCCRRDERPGCWQLFVRFLPWKYEYGDRGCSIHSIQP